MSAQGIAASENTLRVYLHTTMNRLNLAESLAMCFILLIICVIGIANGPVGSVYFYQPEVQAKVVELGLTTKEKIKKRYAIDGVALEMYKFDIREISKEDALE